MRDRDRRRLVRRLGSAVEAALARRSTGDRDTRWSPARADDPRPVTFLLWNVFAMGGTVRTVIRQAEALADRGHPVTIVSVVRHHYQGQAFFPLDPRIRIEVLVDRYRLARRRGPVAALLRHLDTRPAPGSQISLGREQQGSLLTELRVLVCVVRTRGVVIGTRVGLNLAIARFGHPAAIRVAQEHLEFARYEPPVQRAIRRHFRRLDVVACLTEADARSYRRALHPSAGSASEGPTVVVIPNAIPDRLPESADPAVHRIVAVGRLEPTKGFDLLIDAFAKVAPHHPTWTLCIVGDGRRRDQLVAAIARHGLEDRVELRPGTPAVQEELGAASIYVLSSRFEAFGMVLLEAMATGLAVVSFACRQGPREFLVPERNALLAPPKDVASLARQLDRAMADVRLRAELGRAARQDVQAFTVSRVTERWARVLAGAATAPAQPGAGSAASRTAATERTSPANVLGSQPVSSAHRSNR